MQKTFSARSSDARYDEGRFIDAVLHGTGVANAQVEPRAEALFAELPNLAWHQDEPFGSTSIFAQWHVFRLAAEAGVKVMLDGQGADEQLAGYHGFFRARLAGLARRGAYLSMLKDMWGMGRHHGRAMRDALRRPPAPDCLDAARLGARPMASKKAASVRELSEQQLLHTSLPMLLHWEDRDSMAHSVEARLPFLDYRVVELALGLPEEAKLSGGVTKRVLREAMRGVLPEQVRTRMDKIGFATAEEQWMRREQPDGFRKALGEAIEAAQGALRPQAASQLLEDVIAGRRAFSYLPWRMISFGAWMRRFDVSLT
jgi:asparagine synthase (glutamine-hydrolysing)